MQSGPKCYVTLREILPQLTSDYLLININTSTALINMSSDREINTCPPLRTLLCNFQTYFALHTSRFLQRTTELEDKE